VTNRGIDSLLAAVTPIRERVLGHPLYASLDNKAAIHTFMEHHVFAVWDFMSLLKSLQRDLTCVSVPWVPVGATGTRRLINEIVLGEETDELGCGIFSHFELYIVGMVEAGADHSIVDRFIDFIKEGNSVPDAIRDAGVPAPAARFVRNTWGLVENAPLHCRAAGFAFGREDLIPDMFARVVAVNQDSGGLDTFIEYLERHIEVDGEDHSPMAMQMLADLCGDNEARWRECAQTASAAMAARLEFWDGILATVNSRIGEEDDPRLSAPAVRSG
jgi:Protein of unknown function (DUF3050)